MEGRIGPFQRPLLFDDQGLSNLANNEFYQILVNGQPYDGRALAPPVTAVFKLKRGGLSIEKAVSASKKTTVLSTCLRFLKWTASRSAVSFILVKI